MNQLMTLNMLTDSPYRRLRQCLVQIERKRTAMESAAYGCSTITSKNGGLPETFKNPIFINNVNENELFKKIK